MALPDLSLLARTLQRAQRPLLVVPPVAQIDHLATAIALATALRELGSDPVMVGNNGVIPPQLSFLGAPTLLAEIPHLNTLTVRVNVGTTRMDELSYDVAGNELRIHITPAHGAWRREDVTVGMTEYRYDLVIGIGIPSASALTQYWGNAAEFFLATPLLQIDHLPDHEPFGQYPLVDVTASSCGEMAAMLVREQFPAAVTADVATALLTGMVAATKGFTSATVAPRTLSLMSDLLGCGARRDEIMDRLFRTREVETLRLWGRTLTRLQHDPATGFAHTVIAQQDFLATGARPDAWRAIVDDLLTTCQDAPIVLVLVEGADQQIAAHLFARHPHDARALGAGLHLEGDARSASAVLPATDLTSAHQEAVRVIAAALAPR